MSDLRKKRKDTNYKKLLESNKVFENLGLIKISRIILWAIFKPYKSNYFFNRLDDGMIVKFAYEYASLEKRIKK